MIIQNIKTKEKYKVINYNAIFGLLVGGSYMLINLKTKETISISGNKFKKKYKVIKI
tara:strand:- start:171 stop:341 length:171 start_codon:yes stop_codon:yes gene_type:complete